MEIHVDQINCSQDQIVMQSSIQCRTFEFLKAVEKNTCTLQFLGKSCNAKHALLRHFICTLHQVNLFHKTFSVLLHVFQTFNRLGDRFHVVRYFCRPIEMCFPRSLIRQSNRITTKWCLMHWDPELPR